MNDNGLPVVIEDKCVGCGECVKACPQGIMEMHAISHNVLLRCKNEDKILFARQVCTRACIGCGICVREADEGKLTLSNNLAKIDYDKFGDDTKFLQKNVRENVLRIRKTKIKSRETKIKFGLLINFKEKLIKDGITRVVNNL